MWNHKERNEIHVPRQKVQHFSIKVVEPICISSVKQLNLVTFGILIRKAVNA